METLGIYLSEIIFCCRFDCVKNGVNILTMGKSAFATKVMFHKRHRHQFQTIRFHTILEFQTILNLRTCTFKNEGAGSKRCSTSLDRLNPAAVSKMGDDLRLQSYQSRMLRCSDCSNGRRNTTRQPMYCFISLSVICTD